MWIGLTLVCLFGGGCSVRLVSEENLKDNPNVRLIESDERAVVLKFEKDGERKIISVIYTGRSVELEKPCRVRYEGFYWDFLDLIAVPARLPNGKIYTAWIDTGYGGSVMTNGITIIENDLAICPLGQNLRKEFVGICHLPRLEIGQAIIINPPCKYLQIHWQWDVLGLHLWKQKGVVVGLKLLRRFSYVSFDNINKEMELSLEEPFEPKQANKWQSYPLKIEKDESGDSRLMVDIPVGGENLHIMFDTCGRYGMVVGPELCKKISAKGGKVKVRKSRLATGFLGWVECRRAKVAQLDVAGTEIKNAEVIILDKDSPYLAGEGYISMKYFEKSVVVLDFERNLMWIKH